MKRNTEPIVHEIDPRTVKVYVVGDVHVGAAECQLEAFERFLEAVGKDPDAYIVFVGDLANFAILGSKSDCYAELCTPQAQMDYLVQALYPLAQDGRILGIINGNHEQRAVKATSIQPLYDVAVRLGIPEVFREDFAAIRIRMNGGGKTKPHRTYNLLAFHGASRYKVEAMANNIEGFDALLTGHSHAPQVTRPVHICLTQQGTVDFREVVQITGCSWLDYGGYGARAMYKPQVQSMPQALVLYWNNTNASAKRVGVSW